MLSYESFLLISGLFLAGLSAYLLVSFFFNLSQATEGQDLWSDSEKTNELKSSFLRANLYLARQVTVKYSKNILNEKKTEDIEKLILTAGLSKSLNAYEFVGLQTLGGVVTPGFIMIANFTLQMGLSWPSLIVIAVAGYYYPGFYCRQEKKKRDSSVLLDFPFFIDLLALSTEAGVDFINGLQKITEKMKNESVLRDEISTVLQDLKLGSSREEALRGMAYRLDLNEITSFVNLIVDSSQTGVGVSKVLKEQSKQVRSERFIKAEKAGSKASVNILIPMVVFIIPAIFIAVMAPAILSMFYGGN